MRSEPLAREVPIILLTAKGQEKDQAEGYAAGVFAYLIKPISPLELLARVEEALGFD